MLPSEQRNTMKQTDPTNKNKKFESWFCTCLEIDSAVQCNNDNTILRRTHVSLLYLSAARLSLQFLCVTTVF
jgi:hypothetical protein